MRAAQALAGFMRPLIRILPYNIIPRHSRRRTDHLVPFTFDANLTRLRTLLGLVWVGGAAHQLTIIVLGAVTSTGVNKCRGIRRPLDGSHVNLHAGVLNVEFLHAGRHRHEGTRHPRFTEVQVLHAHGKVQLPDVPCEKEDRERSEEAGGRRRRIK